MKNTKWTGTGTLSVVRTGPCPHPDPASRAMPASAPKWVQMLVNGASDHQDNSITAGIDAGEYWVLNGRPGGSPAWLPDDPIELGCPPVLGYMARVVQRGDVVTRIRVTITPDRQPAFQLPKVGHIPGYGLGVIGDEHTSSEEDVTCRITVEVIRAGLYAEPGQEDAATARREWRLQDAGFPPVAAEMLPHR